MNRRVLPRFPMLRTALAVLLFCALGGCSRDEPQPVAPSGSQTAQQRIATAVETPSFNVRPAVHAGSWYPAAPAELRGEIDRSVEAARPLPATAPVLALIAPHAGIRYSGAVAGAAYAALQRQAVRRVFLLGPSHHVGFTGVALPARDLAAYATPLGQLPIDQRALDPLRSVPGFDGPARAHEREHSLEMNTIFIAARFPGAAIVPFVVGQIPDAAFARRLAERIRPLLAAGDVVVTSSDFTHYGPRFNYLPFRDAIPEGLEALADRASAQLVAADLDGFSAHLANTGDTVCGREAIRLLLALLPEGIEAREVARDTSGRMTGDFGNSVTYLAISYRGSSWGTEPGPQGRRPEGASQGRLTPAAETTALVLARRSIETYLGSGRVPAAEELGVPRDGPLREMRAAFVTLKKDGHLRGCIGHIFPVEPLWVSLRNNAIAAAVRDRRFAPVTAAECADLELEVSVLTPPRSIAGPAEFQVGRHGIVLNALGRQAVFLPQVAPEQGWDRETTLSYLARKAGLPALGWKDPAATFQVFEAQVFSEDSRRL